MWVTRRAGQHPGSTQKPQHPRGRVGIPVGIRFPPILRKTAGLFVVVCVTGTNHGSEGSYVGAGESEAGVDSCSEHIEAV